MFKQYIYLILQMLLCAVLFFAILCLLPSCAGTGSLVSDNGDGAFEYRRVQAQQREGEAELAVTGAKLESESREIREGLSELERSIVESQGSEQEIGEILRRVREREVQPDFIEERRNRKAEERKGANGNDCNRREDQIE